MSDTRAIYTNITLEGEILNLFDLCSIGILTKNDKDSQGM